LDGRLVIKISWLLTLCPKQNNLALTKDTGAEGGSALAHF
jgi:hypothetical protein